MCGASGGAATGAMVQKTQYQRDLEQWEAENRDFMREGGLGPTRPRPRPRRLAKKTNAAPPQSSGTTPTQPSRRQTAAAASSSGSLASLSGSGRSGGRVPMRSFFQAVLGKMGVEI